MRLFSLAPFLGGCDVLLELFTNHCHAAGGKPWCRACPESQGESLQGSTGGSSQVLLGRSRTRSLSEVPEHPDMQGGTGGLCEGAGMWPHADCGDAAGKKSEFWKQLQPAIPFTASHQELKGKGGDERHRTSLWGLDSVSRMKDQAFPITGSAAHNRSPLCERPSKVFSSSSATLTHLQTTST